MITIDLGVMEEYDSETNTFQKYNYGKVRFEYSLKAVYEWEGKWKKPFFKGEYTDEELIDFYLKMALDPIDKELLTYDVMLLLKEYMEDPRTATTFSSDNRGEKSSRFKSKAKYHTSEELYVAMANSGIPLEFENRNLNRLLTMLRIVSINNEPPKKMSKQDIVKQNADLNAQRKAAMKTRG